MIIIRLFSMLGLAVYSPYLMLYLNQSYNLTFTFAGMIIALPSIAGAFSQILGGIFTDRFGRRRALLLFFGLNAAINIMLTLSIAVSAPVWLFALMYTISGFIGGMSGPASAAVITDLAPREYLTEAYGLSQLGMNVGWVIGPLLGGFMYSHLSYTYLFAITIPTSVTAFVLAATLIRDSFTGTSDKMRFRDMFSIGTDRALLTYVLLNLLVFTVYIQMLNTYTVFTVKHLGFTTTQYGFLMTLNAVILTVLQYPVTRFVEIRLGDKNALFWGSLLLGVGYLSLSWITTFGWSNLAVTIFSVGELLLMPSLTSTVGRLAGPKERGRYMGLLGTSSGLGIAIAPLLGGALIDASHGSALVIWAPMAAITFIAALGYLRWFAVYKKRLE